MFDIERVLILSPHTDDGEFSCGATITKLIERKIEVLYVAFSAAEASVPDELPSDILRTEVLNATKTLGISQDNVQVLNYPVRKFPQYRQEILEDMVSINNEFQPELILMPASTDTHQDHKTVFEEGFRAFKKRTILGYEIPWNNLDFRTSGFIKVEEEHLRLKIEALKCYKSQSDRSYASEEYVRSLAIARGTQIGSKYAEAFEVIRLVLE